MKDEKALVPVEQKIVEFYEDEKRIIVKLPGEKMFTNFSGESEVLAGNRRSI